MKGRLSGIFGKVFFYTLLILVLVVSVLVAFFADQIKSAVGSTQREGIAEVFQSLIQQAKGKSEEDIIEIARQFHNKNASFEFSVLSVEGKVLYRTDGFVMPPEGAELPNINRLVLGGEPLQSGKFQLSSPKLSEKVQFVSLLSGDVKLLVSGTISGANIYRAFIEQTYIALLLLLLASIGAAALFAHGISKPIRRLAGDARRMSMLEFVAPRMGRRRDEIGQLEEDVYKMYTALQSTIRQLEKEVEREKAMEENQRYFFSAASHELKTPIAATSALLEGMLEKVIEPSEYPAAMREALRMMQEQNKLVSEILDIVALNNQSIVLRRERFKLRSLIASGMSALLSIAESKRQTVEIDIPEGLEAVVDAKLFAKAFSNVMLNAIQNTPEGSRIEVSAEGMGGVTHLSVLNRDAAIPSELLPKLFEPFYREDQARNRDQGRSGLGLTIVKKTLELMDIPYTLENTEQGVLFRMELRAELDES